LLFYASRNGDLESVKLLVLAGARPDDASLHEAARNADVHVASYLLSKGHHANFRSSLHSDGGFGRTALEELCLNATPDLGRDWHTRIHQTIEMLLPPNGEHIGKRESTLIFRFARDNKSSASRIKTALERFPQIRDHQYEDIEDEDSEDEDIEDLYYQETLVGYREGRQGYDYSPGLRNHDGTSLKKDTCGQDSRASPRRAGTKKNRRSDSKRPAFGPFSPRYGQFMRQAEARRPAHNARRALPRPNALGVDGLETVRKGLQDLYNFR